MLEWILVGLLVVVILLAVWLLLRRPSPADGDAVADASIPPADPIAPQAGPVVRPASDPFDQEAEVLEPASDEVEPYVADGEDTEVTDEAVAEASGQAPPVDDRAGEQAAWEAPATDATPTPEDDQPTWETPTTDATPDEPAGEVSESAGGDFEYDQAHEGAVHAAGFDQGDYGPGSARPAEDGSGPPGWLVKGNVGSMLFHTPDSPSYEQSGAEVWFESEDAAKAAGFVHWDRKQR